MGAGLCIRDFHETLQYSALQLAHIAIASYPQFQQSSFSKVAAMCPELLAVGTLSQYYSEEALARGRETFVVPDLQALPSVIAVTSPTWHRTLSDKDFLASVHQGSLESLGVPSLARFAYLGLREGRRKALATLLEEVHKKQLVPKTKSDVFAHETMAYIVLHMVHYASTAAGWSVVDQPFVMFVERFAHLVDPLLYKEFYSERLIFSKEARESLVLPDLSPLPDLVPRAAPAAP